MSKWWLIALGGAIGSLLRYALQSWVQSKTPPEFPAGTLAVNVLGCVAIGVLMGVFTGPAPIREEYRLAIITGVLGGFTTFSAFSWETAQLMDSGHTKVAFAYAGLSVLAGVAGTWLGLRTVQWFSA